MNQSNNKLGPRSPAAAMREFLSHEASAGLLLFGTAAAAVVISNSRLASAYFALININLLGLTILHWINDALMAAFFLLVGLEIKREFLEGQLNSWKRRALPGIAALGGMVVPAIFYLSVNFGPNGAPRGWAVPAATDIAFALGVLSLLGRRVPVSLKVFLTALAIIDDLGAVLIIAAFYTSELDLRALTGVMIMSMALAALNYWGVVRLLPFLVLGLVLWFFVLKSGVHATVAGVILALTVPLGAGGSSADQPLLRLEHRLHPWVTFLVLPVFSFANAGVALEGFSGSILFHPVTSGVALGLFFGKQAGVFSFAWAAVRLGIAVLPSGIKWKQLYGVALLCGIGFTMSLFIGSLAFPSELVLQDAAKLGVIIASLLSAAAGAAILYKGRR